MHSKPHSTCSRPLQTSKPRRPPRRPVFTLTPLQVFRRCRERHHSRICARQVLVVRELMCATGWTIKELARRAHVSVSHISDFLNVKKFFTTESIFRVARAFHLRLSQFDEKAETWRPD
jgi:AraC-like DNA-binding protein